jgi:hypothetical protein
MERLDGTDDNLDNAVGFLLDNAAHDLAAKHKDGDIDKHCQDEAESRLDFREGLAASLEVLGAEVDFGAGDEGIFVVADAVSLEEAVAEDALELTVNVGADLLGREVTFEV